MTFSHHLVAWANANAERLDRLGDVSVRRAGDGGIKPSSHISIESVGRFAEVIVWDSGEAELAYGELGGSATDEHLELRALDELTAVLEQLVDRIRP